jgi:hypothetical protein
LWNPAGVHWNCWRPRWVNPRQPQGYRPGARHSKKSGARIVPRCTSEVAGRGEGSWYAATPVHFTVPKDRCHWPIGHNFPWYFPGAGFWSVRTGRFDTRSRFGEKTCYNPAQEAVVLGLGENGWSGIIGEARTHPATRPAATSIHRH